MKIAALVDDLFFSSKISGVAKHAGAQVAFCRSADTVARDARRILVDLNATSFDPIAEIRKLKAGHPAPIVAYVSHVQVDLKRQAEEAGAGEVIARSALAERLPELLS